MPIVNNNEKETNEVIHYGRKLKNYLINKNISISEFINICKVSKQSAYNYLSRQEFTYYQAMALSKSLSLPLDFFGYERDPIKETQLVNSELFSINDLPHEKEEKEDDRLKRFITLFFDRLLYEISGATSEITIINFLPEEKKFRGIKGSNSNEEHFFKVHQNYIDKLDLFITQNPKIKYTRLYEIDVDPKYTSYTNATISRGYTNTAHVLQARTVGYMLKSHIEHLIKMEKVGRDYESFWTPTPIFRFSCVIIDSKKIITRLDRYKDNFSFPHRLKIESNNNALLLDPVKQTINDFNDEINKIRANKTTLGFSIIAIYQGIKHLKEMLNSKYSSQDRMIEILKNEKNPIHNIEIMNAQDELKKIEFELSDQKEKEEILDKFISETFIANA